MAYRLLVVEDELQIQTLIKDYFTNDGFEVSCASDGLEGLEMFESKEFDLIIMDIMMPMLDGWSLCRRIRKQSDIPIIMLTARNDDEDMVMGFELKADEYVTKPFSPKVLLARAKVLVERSKGSLLQDKNVIQGGPIRIEKHKHKIFVDEVEIEMALKEYEILLHLMENQGIAISRQSILDSVWGYDYFGDDRVVDSHIKKIRKKLGSRAYMIKTVFGVGYKMEEE